MNSISSINSMIHEGQRCNNTFGEVPGVMKLLQTFFCEPSNIKFLRTICSEALAFYIGL